MGRVVVVGGGAAGMMAAAAAAEAGASVTVLEKNEKLGKKLYITGKGRCNVTNACSQEDFLAHVVSNPKFLYSSYSRFGSGELMDWLEHHGLKLKVERGNRVFPQSDKSSDVIRTFQRALEALGVEIRLHCPVQSLFLEDGACRGVALAGERAPGHGAAALRPGDTAPVYGDAAPLYGDAVIVATGGLSYPSTGSTGDGYGWARGAGHTVTDLRPGLVPLEAELGDGSPARELQGLSLKNVEVCVKKGKKKLVQEFGEMLFTHFGVSGPVLLSASSRIARELEKGPLDMEIDWKPALAEEQLDARLQRELAENPKRQVKNLMGALVPAKAIPAVLRLAGIPAEQAAGQVSREERHRLLQTLKRFPVRLTGLRGFPEAVITQGGISVKEIQPATMESKKIRNLFFAGEVLDLDAFTGGYNLQIAWSTGYAAGKAAAERGKEEV